MFGHALVHAFIAAADQQQLAITAQTPGRLLIETLALRRKQHQSLLRRSLRPDALYRLKNGRRLEQHAFASAEWPIVYSAMPVVCPVSKIVNVNLDQSRFSSFGHNAMLKRPLKKFGEDRENTENHRLPVSSDPPALQAA